MCSPKIIKGNSYTDQRGILNYNNLFNASGIKRIYIIENSSTKIFRGWQGHKIEQRWFCSVQGSFRIKLIEIDDWNSPSKSLVHKEIKLEAKKQVKLGLNIAYRMAVFFSLSLSSEVALVF